MLLGLPALSGALCPLPVPSTVVGWRGGPLRDTASGKAAWKKSPKWRQEWGWVVGRTLRGLKPPGKGSSQRQDKRARDKWARDPGPGLGRGKSLAPWVGQGGTSPTLPHPPHRLSQPSQDPHTGQGGPGGHC